MASPLLADSTTSWLLIFCVFGSMFVAMIAVGYDFPGDRMVV